ncbi:kinase-like domain-containing protein [Mycena filopes]|nr:kinase-like domain-containing protein [Mycena filopes]
MGIMQNRRIRYNKPRTGLVSRKQMTPPDKYLRSLKRQKSFCDQPASHPVQFTPERRYSILHNTLGAGRHSRVLAGIDLYAASHVAVKRITRKDVETEAIKWELKILSTVSQLPHSPVAYGDNLATVLREPRLSTLPLFQVKEVTRQLIQAIRHLHDNNITHADIKPENIVFLSKDTVTQHFYGMDNIFHERTILRSCEICIVDFGSVPQKKSATFKGETGSVGYRAPEVVMGTQYAHSSETGATNGIGVGNAGWHWTQYVDHFALGCVIAEMLTSKPLLPPFTTSVVEDLIVMDKTIGPFPPNLSAMIEKQFPTLFAYRINPSPQISHRTQEYLSTAKPILERIEDRAGAKLVRTLTALDHNDRGDLRHLERCKFVATHEM